VSEKYVSLEWSFVRCKKTTMQEKLVLSEISQLTMLDLGCIASNEHFAALMGVKKQAVSRCISSLEKKGYITTKIKNGSRNHERTITINKLFTPHKQNVTGVLTKCLETKENNTINNTVVDKKPSKRFSKPTADQINDYLKQTNNDNKIDADAFIDYYQAKDWMIGSNRMKDWKAAVRTWLRRETKTNTQTKSKTNIKAEIFDRISKGYDGTHQWNSEEAKKVFEQMRKASRGVPWTGNEWQINQAIQEAI